MKYLHFDKRNMSSLWDSGDNLLRFCYQYAIPPGFKTSLYPLNLMALPEG